MKFISAASAATFAALIAGCSTTVVDTNREARIAAPTIATTDSLATVEVGEQVSGRGCAKEFLMIFKSGDNKFLEVHGAAGSDATDRAKAAATYKALAGDKGLSTDIIVQPVWEITRDRTLFGILTDDVCAKVVGYRGVIKSIQKTDTVTKPVAAEPKKSLAGGFWNLLK